MDWRPLETALPWSCTKSLLLFLIKVRLWLGQELIELLFVCVRDWLIFEFLSSSISWRTYHKPVLWCVRVFLLTEMLLVSLPCFPWCWKNVPCVHAAFPVLMKCSLPTLFYCYWNIPWLCVVFPVMLKCSLSQWCVLCVTDMSLVLVMFSMCYWTSPCLCAVSCVTETLCVPVLCFLCYWNAPRLSDVFQTSLKCSSSPPCVSCITDVRSFVCAADGAVGGAARQAEQRATRRLGDVQVWGDRRGPGVPHLRQARPDDGRQ